MLTFQQRRNQTPVQMPSQLQRGRPDLQAWVEPHPVCVSVWSTKSWGRKSSLGSMANPLLLSSTHKHYITTVCGITISGGSFVKSVWWSRVARWDESVCSHLNATAFVPVMHVSHSSLAMFLSHSLALLFSRSLLLSPSLALSLSCSFVLSFFFLFFRCWLDCVFFKCVACFQEQA